MKELYLLEYEFTVTRPINNVHFYQGIYWSAVIREFLRKYIKEEFVESFILSDLGDEKRNYLFQMGIQPIAPSKGMHNYFEGEKVYFQLLLPAEYKSIVQASLNSIAKNGYRDMSFPPHCIFFPGKNIKLSNVKCLVSGETNLDKWQVLTNSNIEKETDLLFNSRELTIVFHTPLRMSLEGGTKDRPWMDILHWDTVLFLSKLADKLEAGIPQADLLSVQTLDCGFCWIDRFDEANLSLGGLCGAIHLHLPVSRPLYKMLVEGQYSGIGKNTSLGFGFYYIAESSLNPLKKMPATAVTFRKRAADKELLHDILFNLDNDSSGPDNLTSVDLKENEESYLEVLHNYILAGNYIPGPTKKITIKNSQGTERTISIRNIKERHFLAALDKAIYDGIDEQIPFSVYAYRKGKRYLDAVKAVLNGFHKGFQIGIKTDIDAFFDSINTNILSLQIQGMYGLDPIFPVLDKIIKVKSKGIEQGNPLSPLLSNIHLLPLDREFMRKGFHYVRYADDLVLMDKNQADPEKLFTLITKTLALLKLHLAEDKTCLFHQEDEIIFLGHKINTTGSFNLSKLGIDTEPIISDKDNSSQYSPVFPPGMEEGIPVYVTFKETSVRASATELLIESNELTQHISWNMISRIVIIGKPRISAYTIYRALSLGKPVIFLSITGKPVGSFYPHKITYTTKEICNTENFSFPDFQLSFIRNIVYAKLTNQYHLLHKNGIDCQEILSYRNNSSNLTNPNELRGMEGAGAALYWKHFSKLVSPFQFSNRQYHHSPDPINSLLSLGYVILYNLMTEGLIAAGLSPWIGIFHSPSSMHYALASDMIEPYRFLIDRIVLAMIHNRQLTQNDFIIAENSKGKYYYLQSDGFRKYINRLEQTLHDKIKDTEGKERTWIEMIDFSCRQLVNALRIGIPFQPFILKK